MPHDFPSAPPFQRNWSGHGMFHLRARALGFQVCRLQSEVPLGGAIGVFDQHQMRIVFETFALQFHGAAVLLDKFGENKFQ